MTLGTAQVHAAPHLAAPADAWVRRWLWFIAFLVLCMIVVGGATRLTDSGLSITEWRPILGAIPPLSEADWLAAFDLYKQIPEYRLVNQGMNLEDFKVIYWWEWGHRFLGRIIGIAFAIPLAIFWLRGMLWPGNGWKYLGVLALGGLQGAIGWYMVSSGLVDRIDVSQYRLALHLSVAFLILGALVWLAMELTTGPRGIRLRTITRSNVTIAAVIVALVFLQVALGAFVAGLKAGLHFNTWPLMNDELVPSGILSMSPWYINFFENPTAAQFNHRLVAYIIVALGLMHGFAVARRADDERVRNSAILLAITLLAQMVLGIVTLLWAVPIGLGIAHQGLAAVLFAIAVRHLYLVRQAKSA